MIKQQKIELRQQIKQLKSELSDEERQSLSETIFEKIEALPAFQNATVVLVYWSMYDEVATHIFIEKWWQKKTILLPIVDGDVLRIKQYTGKQNMTAGKRFGILEPTGFEYTTINEIQLIIVPGVAFDNNNNRMGRGKGFYDKLLTTTKALKIGVCFSCQFFDNIPVEKHDLRMDLVIKA